MSEVLSNEAMDIPLAKPPKVNELDNINTAESRDAMRSIQMQEAEEVLQDFLADMHVMQPRDMDTLNQLARDIIDDMHAGMITPHQAIMLIKELGTN